ncbi:MAG: squalene/phytoene synthase family protein [Alphaproteobacteria bacterium]|nr:squalene/phytoene synthase family protein [Alphaproteobacteria bacterium]
MPPSNHTAEKHSLKPGLTQGFLAELRSKDYERFLICLFTPLACRDDIAALFLFNAELAQIRDQVTEPLLGQIRLQWWREALDKLGTPEQPPHALLDRLTHWQQRGISLAPLRTLLDARATDLLAEPFPSLAAYDAYRHDTSAPLGTGVAAILGHPTNAALFAEIMTNYATIGLLRALPHWLHHRQMPLPPEVIAQYTINAGALTELKPQSGLAQWSTTTAQQARKKCKAHQHQLRALPAAERRGANLMLLHNSLTQFYALQILRANGDSLHPAPAPTGRLFTLLWTALRG